MKTAILASALAGTALAQNPAHLTRRQATPLDELPEVCRAALSAINADAPPGPTAFTAASSSYYETATRTATGAYEDCAWITAIPESLHPEYAAWVKEATEWQASEDYEGLAAGVGEACRDVDRGEAECVEEWGGLRQKVAEGAVGEDEEEDKSDAAGDVGDDKEEDESAAAEVRAYAAGALLAAFAGGVALL